ncbi:MULTISPECIES: M67 family metallopeptidase [Brevibacillus]|nr:M67 family metallopeptidase [Brevibacillus sp. AY1]
MPVLYASKKVWKEMYLHCQAERPYEACGLLSGRNGRAETIWRMANIDKSPVSFSMDLEQLQSVFHAIRARGERLVAVYHSHPTAPPVPSSEDIAFFSYPEAAYIIVSLTRKHPAFACYQIRERIVTPQKVSFY